MEAVFQYEIPVLHPVIVHFPPALMLAAAVAGLGWVVRGTAFWRKCLTFLLVLAAVGTAFAYVTGEAMYERSAGVPIIEELVHLHQQMGLYALIAVGAALAGTVGCSVGEAQGLFAVPWWLRLLVGGAVLLAAALVLWTAHVGGTMTWGVMA